MRRIFSLIVLCCSSLVAFADDPQPENPVDPRAAIGLMDHHPDVKVELVASEPQIVDPVAARFDASGRLWVVEMRDYPNGPAAGQPGKSRIRILTDNDADGFFETATTFADELLFANGLQPWRDGVIVTLGGSVVWMRDTNNDGRVDEKETWFTGFAEKNPQLRANHPTLAADNWIYVANGLRGGKVIARRPAWSANAPVVDVSGRDFRFHPLTGQYEAISGVGQFGMTFDDDGNRFVCSNRNPCKHIVLEDRHLKNNPQLAVPSVAHDVSPPGEASRVYAINRPWTTSTLHAGQFTAACGVTIYRGNALPQEFYGNSFTCEPTGGLIHRDVLTPSGATFDSRYSRDKQEFLASKDDWFRAVNLFHGPDGCLYVCDMYRAVIEHPQFMPTELKTRGDLTRGNDRGRIYRIVPANKANSNSDDPKTNYASLSNRELFGELGHENVWQRETVARLLLEKQDKSIVPELNRIVVEGTNSKAQIQALQVLDGLNMLDAGLLGKVLSAALKQQQSGKRWPELRNAVRLAEKFIPQHPKLVALLTNPELSSQPADFFEIVRVLSKADPLPREYLTAVGRVGGRDPWIRTAVLAAAPDVAVAMLDQQSVPVGDTKTLHEILRDAAQLVGARNSSKEISSALLLISTGSVAAQNASPEERLEAQIVAASALARGLARSRSSLAKATEKSSYAANVSALFKAAAGVVRDNRMAKSLRIAACELLTRAPADIAVSPLEKLATDASDRDLRRIGIESLAAQRSAAIGGKLIPQLSSETPVIQRAILAAMLTTPGRARELLQAVEDGVIPLTQLDPATVNRLKNHSAPNVHGWARRLFAASVPQDRKNVLQDYQAALQKTPDSTRGLKIFQKNCASCHKIGEHGVNVAPDIADSRTKTPDYLLTNILDPNRAVDANYFGYTIVLNSGRVLTGIVTSESANSVSLKQQEGKTVQVLRSEIDTMRSTGKSLMPVGLEKNITVQDMADLIGFIKNWRYLDGRIPLTSDAPKRAVE